MILPSPTQKILLRTCRIIQRQRLLCPLQCYIPGHKKQEEKVKIDFTSDNTEVYNKPFRLRDLRRSIMKAKPRAPTPKPNKDHTDPFSYWPIALTSCLCKVLEGMINTRFLWYLDKKRILDRSQCGFRKHRSTTDHLVSLERYLRDAFAQRQQTIGLFFDL